jgi:hypothetical protein
MITVYLIYDWTMNSFIVIYFPSFFFEIHFWITDKHQLSLSFVGYIIGFVNYKCQYS